jgi:hypothetical protein
MVFFTIFHGFTLFIHQIIIVSTKKITLINFKSTKCVHNYEMCRMGGFEGVVAPLVLLLSYLAPASLGLAIGNAIEKYSGPDPYIQAKHGLKIKRNPKHFFRKLIFLSLRAGTA